MHFATLRKAIQYNVNMTLSYFYAFKMYKQRYYIGFPGYLTVLLASDFCYIFLCCGIALKIKLSCKFPAEFCNLSGSCERYIAPLYHESRLVNSLLIICKSIGNSNYLNKLKLSIKKIVRDLVDKPRPFI